MNRRFASVSLAAILFVCVPAVPRTLAQTQSASALPRLVRFGGVLRSANGTPLTGVVGVTFALYSEQTGGAALWLETQNVTADSSGHYSALLGSTKPEGLPSEMFTSEQARWIGVQVSGQSEQPRVLLVSAPYALKAGDAETLGGLPPSAFMLATPALNSASSSSNANATQSSAPPPAGAVTGTGTANYVPLWDATSDIISSVITQTGSGATAKIGIGVANPAAALDIKGGEYVRGALTLPATANATATKGANSQPEAMIASVFNSGTSTAVNQKFQLQAEPAGNDTATASGTLNLLYGSGTAAPAETGFKINALGQITFATGQAFPGTGAGSVTSVASGAGLAGGPITSSGTLSIAPAGVTNAMLANPSLTVTAGTGLTGGGAIALGGSTTLNLDTTKIPQLAAANTFTGSQTVNGNLSATGVVTGSSFQIGSNLFDYGSYAAENAFLGFAGNSTITGQFNTAVGPLAFINNTSGRNNTVVGVSALTANTTGSYNTGIGTGALPANSTGIENTAVGDSALNSNTTGGSNTADGRFALYYNTTGADNTALGYLAGTDALTPSLTNTTAIGAYADVTVNNAIVLGGITGTNGCTTQKNCASVNVGIGTTAPASTLDVHGTGNFTGAVNFGAPVTFAAGQIFPGTITAVNAGTDVTASISGGGVTLNVDTTKVPQLSGNNVFVGSETISASGLGLAASTSSTGQPALYGSNNATSGVNAIGVLGQAYSSSGSAVEGTNFATTGDAKGVFGQSQSSTGSGVYGIGNGSGVTGLSNSTSGSGLVGVSSGSGGYGVFASNTATTGGGNGVYGQTSTPTGSGVVGLTLASGATGYGVYGQSSNTGVYGTGNATGVTGSSSGTGVYGTGGSIGVTGSSPATGVFGLATATSGTASGVVGQSNSPNGSGVTGLNSSGGNGVSGQGVTGVYGAGAGSGLTGVSTSSTGSGVVGIMNSGGGYAGYFQGNVAVTGNLSNGGNVAVTGNVSIGGDKPMSRSPRMTFSGTVASFTTSPQAAGYFIPDQSIVITRFTVAVGFGQTPTLCTSPESMSLTINGNAGAANVVAASGGFHDSHALNIPVSAGTPIYMYGNSASGDPGCQSGNNITGTVEYAMQ